MDSFSSPWSASSPQISHVYLMNQVKSELAQVYAEEFLETVRGKCFDKCITKPGLTSRGSNLHTAAVSSSDRGQKSSYGQELGLFAMEPHTTIGEGTELWSAVVKVSYKAAARRWRRELADIDVTSGRELSCAEGQDLTVGSSYKISVD
ncbi:Mitochondrial import inner membrane translocase subunit TIM13 [Striga hermonthica]|uniref:Mitochondrial import inner membrane translocase subunit TIM13 n=1 Tax=Striga hermonthica TaxID=68872 RepID=A0A9N7NVZ7_STRHE|nr:Mitochondrial import inner membrane translocase subunit TIM13 [Striga hermonthica]